MLYDDIVSERNLLLAWRRITTGMNLSYKRFFRPLYEAFEVGLPANLSLLHQKLLGGWKASPPQKVFMPKPSGLLRPIGILRLEDQIVLQAVANVCANRLAERRKRLERRFVFSNILPKCHKSDIFFMEPWQASYARLREKIQEYYDAGYRWIAHFDLSAFFDTICHELLVRTISPRGGHEDAWARVRTWLRKWTSAGGNLSVNHGIPQGPLASNFLAECVLLPLDEAMAKARINYVRYVDDIRLFAEDKLEAARAALEMEMRCRNLGLIPHGDKYAIRPATSVVEALGSLPSMAVDADDDDVIPVMTRRKAERTFRRALDGKPLRIADKSRAKYVLYRAPASPKLLTWVLRFIPQHPEHIDAFAAYLTNYRRSTRVERAIMGLLRSRQMPYDYVRGELWHLLARLGSRKCLSRLRRLAESEARNSTSCVGLEWGALAFLLSCSDSGLGDYSRHLLRATPLVKALLIPRLPDAVIEAPAIGRRFLAGPDYEPGLMMARRLLDREDTHRRYGVKSTDLPLQVQNVFRTLGLIRPAKAIRLDQIGEMLADRYGISYWKKWRSVLGKEYKHALGILRLGDALFDSGRSSWLQNQNSFNDILVRRLQGCITRLGLPGSAKIIGRDGQLVDMGVLLDPAKDFHRTYPIIAGPLKAGNDRRNALPGSHPYSKKTGQRNKFLEKKEQDKLHSQFKAAYAEIAVVFKPL